jgi:hypothetical protein
MITVHPQQVKREALVSADVVIAVGKDPQETIRAFCRATEIAEPRLEPVELERWEVLAWFRGGDADPFVVIIEPGKIERKRHIRKYADGDMREDSFIFRGRTEGSIYRLTTSTRSSGWRRGSMMRRGCIICAVTTTRIGCGRE